MTPAKFKVIVARRQTNEEHNQCYNRSYVKYIVSNLQTDDLIDFHRTTNM